MSFKDKFKKYKKILIGVVVLASGVGVYKYNQYDDDRNLLVLDRPLGKLMIVGDTGEHSRNRDALVSYLDLARPDALALLGDEKYPDGIQSDAEFEEFIKRPFYRPGRLVLFVGGNHTQYAYKNRDFLLRLARSGKHPWFIYLNYYWGITASDGCFAFQDSAIYDVKIVHGEVKKVRSAQEDFIGKFPKIEACQGKLTTLLGHHGIYASDDGHGDRPEGRFTKFYKKSIRGAYRVFVNGHSHVTSKEACEKGTCHYTVGAGAKSSACTRGKGTTCFERPGVLEIFQGQEWLRVIETN